MDTGSAELPARPPWTQDPRIPPPSNPELRIPRELSAQLRVPELSSRDDSAQTESEWDANHIVSVQLSLGVRKHHGTSVHGIGTHLGFCYWFRIQLKTHWMLRIGIRYRSHDCCIRTRRFAISKFLPFYIPFPYLNKHHECCESEYDCGSLITAFLSAG